MPTSSPRVHVVCEAPVYIAINDIAKEEHRSMSAIAHDLIVEALDRREDLYFSELAEQRENKSFRVMSHQKAWG
jgi:hypothetical protein